MDATFRCPHPRREPFALREALSMALQFALALIDTIMGRHWE